jgi:hypothetical protein
MTLQLLSPVSNNSVLLDEISILDECAAMN